MISKFVPKLYLERERLDLDLERDLLLRDLDLDLERDLIKKNSVH